MADDPNDSAARRIYDGNAATPLPERKGEFYSWTPGDSVMDQRQEELRSRGGIDSAGLAQRRNTYRSIDKETERTTGAPLPAGVLMDIFNGDIDGSLAGTRVLDEAEAEADAVALGQRIQAGNAEVREKLTAMYGAKEAEAILKRMEKFVRATPALAKILQQHGLGARPEIVLGIASHVHSTGYR